MKKWTYLVAACMLAGTTPVLTGCIDNDEPTGIEQLRVAKSELIKAKVSLTEAEKGKMEAEKAKIMAEAAVLEAKAAILDAYARKQEALATAAEDSAAYIAKIYDLKIQEEQARVNKKIAEYKQKQAEAEAAYQEALKDIELAKLTLSAEQWESLAHYTTAVDEAKAELDRYQSYYERHLEAYNTAFGIYMSGEGNAIKFQYGLEKGVRSDSAEVVSAQEAVELAKETLEKPIEATAWEEEKLQLEAELAELEKQEADMKVVAAKFQAAHQEEDNAMQDSLDKAVDTYGATVKYEDENGNIQESSNASATGLKLSAYEYDAETATFGENVTITFNLPEAEYNYQAYADGVKAIEEGDETIATLAVQGIYPFVQLYQMDRFIENVNRLTLNDNQKEWQVNDIAVLNVALTAKTAEYEEAYAEWNNVKNAFNHVAAVTDPTQLPVGKTLNDAITAYNTAAEANKTAIAALATAETAFLNALKDADENATSINDYTSIHTVLQAEVTAQTLAVTNAKTVYDAAVTTLEALEGNPDATNAQITAAQQAVDDALKAMNDANTLLATAQANLTAVETANTTYNTAYDAVEGKVNTTTGNREGGSKAAARTAYNAAADAYCAYVAYLIGQDTWTWTDTDYLGTAAQLTKVDVADEDGNVLVTPMVAADVLEVSQDQMKSVLQEVSAEVWGNAWIRQEDQVRILPATKEDVDVNIAELYALSNNGEEIPEYLIQFEYATGYGLFGQTLDLQADIDRATAYLNGGAEEIKRIVAEIEAVKAEMQKEIDANTKLVTDLIDGFLTARTAYNQAYQTEVGEELAAISAQKLQLQPVINALKGAIDGYLIANKGDNYAYAAESVAEFKQRLEDILANAQEALLEAEANLEASRADLANYLAGFNDRDQALKTADDNLKRAKEKLEAAQKVYDDAVAELQAILDALSAE